jgi:hypothetical protein
MLTIRPATPADIPQVLAFIRELADYEREPASAIATHADLLRDGWGPTPRFHCLIAEVPSTDNLQPATCNSKRLPPPSSASRASPPHQPCSARSIGYTCTSPNCASGTLKSLGFLLRPLANRPVPPGFWSGSSNSA